MTLFLWFLTRKYVFPVRNFPAKPEIFSREKHFSRENHRNTSDFFLWEKFLVHKWFGVGKGEFLTAAQNFSHRFSNFSQYYKTSPNPPKPLHNFCDPGGEKMFVTKKIIKITIVGIDALCAKTSTSHSRPARSNRLRHFVVDFFRRKNPGIKWLSPLTDPSP